MAMINQAYDAVMRQVMHLSYREWMVVFAIAVTLGVLCLRGFGSRHNY